MPRLESLPHRELFSHFENGCKVNEQGTWNPEAPVPLSEWMDMSKACAPGWESK